MRFENREFRCNMGKLLGLTFLLLDVVMLGSESIRMCLSDIITIGF